jgi:biotin carboxylase
MRILVMHRVPDSFVHYAENIDHTAHDVTYVSVPARVATLPANVPARRLQRQGTCDTAAEVIAAVVGLPRPDLVIALSEYDLLPAARVREALQVPGPAERDILPVRDKVVMKAAAAAAGLRVPRFVGLAAALRDGAGALPWQGRTVRKPLAGASSEGISTFPTAAAALDAVRLCDARVRIDDYEIEEFVEGPIFHVDGLMAAGQPIAIQPSRYVGTCLGYALGSPLGSVQTEIEPGMTDWSLRCLKSVGIDDGPFHLEGIDAADGMVFLEVGARFGGADVVDTFALATGVHMPSAQVRQLVGDAGAVPAPRVPGPGQRYGWFVVPGHTLGSRYCLVSGTEPFHDDPVVYRWVQRAPGEPVKDSITYADSDVPLAGVIGPASTESLEQFMTGLFESVRVEPHELGTA